jgi:hypothetical protein
MISIPHGRGFVCAPAFADLLPVAKKNSGMRGKACFGIDVKNWRKEIVETAAAYMKGIGLEPAGGTIDAGLPVIVSGHQPYQFHAGVLYKYRLLSTIPRSGGVALWITMDTDRCQGFPAKIPFFDGSPRAQKVLILPEEIDSFYADVKTDPKRVLAFRDRVVSGIGNEPGGFFEYGLGFLDDAVGKGTDRLPELMRDFMSVLRRDYAKGWGGSVYEIPLSTICETDDYFSFLFGMLRRAESFRDSFNSILRDYRTEHKLRSSANPFPDLAGRGEYAETLFWIVRDGKREPLFAGREGGDLTLDNLGQTAIAGPEDLKELAIESNARIWPRAVALSILQRIFLGDLFIHGVGGAKYDRITDSLIRAEFDFEPPIHAVATCTLGIEGVEDPSVKLEEAKQREREMKFHPERFIGINPEIAGVIEKKNSLVEEIKVDGADKKSIGKEISSINSLLMGKLEPERERLLGEINRLSLEAEKYDILSDREFPFFLFPPESFPDPKVG